MHGDRMDAESDTCLVVVTVFKIVAPALRAGGWVRFPPSPPNPFADFLSVLRERRESVSLRLRYGLSLFASLIAGDRARSRSGRHFRATFTRHFDARRYADFGPSHHGERKRRSTAAQRSVNAVEHQIELIADVLSEEPEYRYPCRNRSPQRSRSRRGAADTHRRRTARRHRYDRQVPSDDVIGDRQKSLMGAFGALHARFSQIPRTHSLAQAGAKPVFPVLRFSNRRG